MRRAPQIVVLVALLLVAAPDGARADAADREADRRAVAAVAASVTKTWTGPGGRPALQTVAGLDTTAIDPSFDLFGGGGPVSTATEVTGLLQALGDGDVLGPRALRQMLRVASPAAGGLGLSPVRVAGRPCWHHPGFWGIAAGFCPAPACRGSSP